MRNREIQRVIGQSKCPEIHQGKEQKTQNTKTVKTRKKKVFILINQNMLTG